MKTPRAVVQIGGWLWMFLSLISPVVGRNVVCNEGRASENGPDSAMCYVNTAHCILLA